MLLEIRNLAKRYGEQTALADISFDLREGEVLGVIGPNGAGKTTLMECIAGMLAADSGEVIYRGAVLSVAHRKRAMIYLPDGVAPWDDQLVVHVLTFVAASHRLPRQRMRDVAGIAGLDTVLGKRVAELSKGYRRRLVLALGLLAPQPILLMDEPFDGFDLRQTREAMTLLRELAARGRALVLSIHQLTDAERVCDRVVLLSGGRVKGIGTVDELRLAARLSTGGLEEIFLALT
ncbi:MAG TPA: ABC transporter ATP-binding protein [Stellaceae bacterium]|nr:ABC transporter ATP-binding protein [Stellaceae bacterium]